MLAGDICADKSESAGGKTGRGREIQEKYRVTVFYLLSGVVLAGAFSDNTCLQAESIFYRFFSPVSEWTTTL